MGSGTRQGESVTAGLLMIVVLLLGVGAVFDFARQKRGRFR